MKTLHEVEQMLKELDTDLTIVPNENNELAGIYWKGHFAGIAMSKEGAKDVTDLSFTDNFDRPHPTIEKIVDKVNNFLENIKRPEYLEMVTDTSE